MTDFMTPLKTTMLFDDWWTAFLAIAKSFDMPEIAFDKDACREYFYDEGLTPQEGFGEEMDEWRRSV